VLRLLGGARDAWAPTGEERGGGILCLHMHSLFISVCMRLVFEMHGINTTLLWGTGIRGPTRGLGTPLSKVTKSLCWSKTRLEDSRVSLG